jgi:hypothetical protein
MIVEDKLKHLDDGAAKKTLAEESLIFFLVHLDLPVMERYGEKFPNIVSAKFCKSKRRIRPSARRIKSYFCKMSIPRVKNGY